mgnify:CR=1 FL=1
MAQTGFQGFPPETLKFYKNLMKNNNKQWFASHKGDFDSQVMDPARKFVIAMGERLARLSPGIIADPRTDRSIFRIFRDTRFSRDKTPYKTNLALWFWEGERPRMECSGYYFHLEPSMLMLGAGVYMFPKDLLKVYRESVADEKHGAELEKALKAIARKGGYLPGGEQYKTVPRGYDPNHPRAELLKYGGLYTGIELPVPPELHTSKLVEFCFNHYKNMAALHTWLLAMTRRAPQDKKIPLAYK